jgi:hypothetical protein
VLLLRAAASLLHAVPPSAPGGPVAVQLPVDVGRHHAAATLPGARAGDHDAGEVLMATKQTCPRRMSDWGPWEREEGLDTWRNQGGIIGQEKIGLGCSFCGSLHPDRFMELVREGWVVGPTDKSYKAYLGKPLTDEEKAARKAQWMEAGHGIAQAIRDLGAKDGKIPEQIAADVEDEWNTREAPLMASHGQEAKFYYQHLSEAQRDEFVQLYNSKQMKVGYPGYFYRLPFFCSRQPAAGA